MVFVWRGWGCVGGFCVGGVGNGVDVAVFFLFPIWILCGW